MEYYLKNLQFNILTLYIYFIFMLPFLQLFIYFLPCIFGLITDSLTLLNSVFTFFLNPLSDVLFRPGAEAAGNSSKIINYSNCSFTNHKTLLFRSLNYNNLNPIIRKAVSTTITTPDPLNELYINLTKYLISEVNPNLSSISIKRDSLLRVGNLYTTLINNLPSVSTKVHMLGFMKVGRYGKHYYITDLSNYVCDNNYSNDLVKPKFYFTSVHKSKQKFNQLEEGNVITYNHTIGHEKLSMLVYRPHNIKDITSVENTNILYPNYFMLSSSLMGCVGHLNYKLIPDIDDFISMYYQHLVSFNNMDILEPLCDDDIVIRDYLSRIKFLRLNQDIFKDMVKLIIDNEGVLSEDILKEVFYNCIAELKKTL